MKPKYKTKHLAKVTREICENLYAKSPSKVYDYANKIKLRYDACKPCEADTPTISDEDSSTCALCGTVKHDVPQPKYKLKKVAK